MGLRKENTHICEPENGSGDQLASPRWSQGGRKEVARRSRGGRKEVAGRYQGGTRDVPAMVRKEMCSGQGLPGEVFTI